MRHLQGAEPHTGKAHEWRLVVDLVGGHRLSLSADSFCLLTDRLWTRVLFTNESRFVGASLHAFEGPVAEVVFH